MPNRGFSGKHLQQQTSSRAFRKYAAVPTLAPFSLSRKRASRNDRTSLRNQTASRIDYIPGQSVWRAHVRVGSRPCGTRMQGGSTSMGLHGGTDWFRYQAHLLGIGCWVRVVGITTGHLAMYGGATAPIENVRTEKTTHQLTAGTCSVLCASCLLFVFLFFFSSFFCVRSVHNKQSAATY